MGQAPEDGDIAGLVSFVGDPDLKFREREVLNTHPREGADSASGFKKRQDDQTLGATSSVGGVEEGFRLVLAETINRTFLLFGYLEADTLTGCLEEIFGLVVGIVAIPKDLGHPADVLLASLCGHGHSISPFRFSCMRTKKYALQQCEA